MSKNMSLTKSLCTVCGCIVKIEGHADRCKVPSNDGSVLRRLAWLGDVRHTADVRVMLLNTSLSDSELQVHAARYLSRHHQALFYKNYSGTKVAASGSSSHSVSTAFEASYCGDFRRDYLTWLGRLVGDQYVISSTCDPSLSDMYDQLV